MEKKASAGKSVREVRRKTRRRFSAEEKIRIVIERLRGEESIASLCRRESIVFSGQRKQDYVKSAGAGVLRRPQ